jgi:hypothetical protein
LNVLFFWGGGFKPPHRPIGGSENRFFSKTDFHNGFDKAENAATTNGVFGAKNLQINIVKNRFFSYYFECPPGQKTRWQTVFFYGE